MKVIAVKILEKVSAPWSWKLRGLLKVRAGILMYTCFLLRNPAVHLNTLAEMFVCLHVMIEKLMSLMVYMLSRSKNS
jgi:hypothetical protein